MGLGVGGFATWWNWYFLIKNLLESLTILENNVKFLVIFA